MVVLTVIGAVAGRGFDDWAVEIGCRGCNDVEIPLTLVFFSEITW